MTAGKPVTLNGRTGRIEAAPRFTVYGIAIVPHTTIDAGLVPLPGSPSFRALVVLASTRAGDPLAATLFSLS